MAIRLPEFEDMLLELCQVSITAPDAGAVVPACVQLIQEVLAKGREEFVDEHTQSPGPSEYRLNGAGLKLLYEVDTYRDGDETRVYVAKLRIGGDQVEDYPAFVHAAEPILQSASNAAARRAA